MSALPTEAITTALHPGIVAVRVFAWAGQWCSWDENGWLRDRNGNLMTMAHYRRWRARGEPDPTEPVSL